MSREIFDKIASGWYNFRHWSIFRNELDELAERWEKGSVLNIGCGHGPDFLPFKDSFHLYGIDFSRMMLEHARKYSDKFGYSPVLIQGDIRSLPFADSSFEYAIAVASYHHISKKTERLSALWELKRVLAPGGYGTREAEALHEAWRAEGRAPDDLVATLVAFTAQAVAHAADHHLPPGARVDALLVGGGGARNPTLMAALGEALPGVRV
ncbi:MAG: anhydro-N-acetylmuramic acid kinase, partial [Dehalococcoidales bacterium]